MPTIELDSSASCGGGGRTVVTPDAQKIPSVDTRFSFSTFIPRARDEAIVKSVTPPHEDRTTVGSGKNDFDTGDDESEETIILLEDLFTAMDDSIKWKTKKRAGEERNPHPVKLLLETKFKDKDHSIEELLFKRSPLLKAKYHGEKLQNFPLQIRLFLLSLCATLFGLPGPYHIDPWDLVASVWSSDISSKDVNNACKSAIDEFVWSSCSSKDVPVPKNATSFVRRCKTAMNWPPPQRGGHASFCSNLMKDYASDNLMKDIFASTTSPGPETWNIGAKIFLHAMIALISGGTIQDSGIAIVAKYVAGCPVQALIQLNAATLMKTFIEEFNTDHTVLPARTATSNPWGKTPVVIEDEPVEVPLCPGYATTFLRVEAAMEEEWQRLQSALERIAEKVGPTVGHKEIFSRFQQRFHNVGCQVPKEEADNASSQLEAEYEEECRRRQNALDVNVEQAAMDPKERDLRFQDFFHTVAGQLLKEEEASNAVATLHVGKGKGKHKVDCMHLPRSRGQMKFSELKSNKSKKTRAAVIALVMEHQAGSSEESEQEELLRFLVKKRFPQFVLHQDSEIKFDIGEASALKVHLGLTVTQMCKIVRSMKALKVGLSDMWPKQFKKKMLLYEQRNVVAHGTTKVPLKMNATGVEKFCVYSCAEEPCLLGSKQIEGTFVAGKFETSATFSYHNNKIIIILGIDKDSGQTTIMIRIANRKDGNCNEFVVPLAYYEQGAECYENLKRTFLKEGCPTRNFVQLLLNNRFFVLVVNSVKGKDLSSRCVYLNLFSFDPSPDVMFPEVDLKLQRLDDVFYLREDCNLTCSTYSGNDCIGVDFWNARAWREGGKFIALQLVWDTSNEDNVEEYHGFCLLSGWRGDDGMEHLESEPFHRGRFEKPLRRDPYAACSCNLLQAIGFMSSDKKNSWIVSGMHDSWTQHVNCITCMTPRSEYKVSNGKAYPLRCGDHSTLQSYLKWKEATKGNRKLKKKELDDLKILCGSVYQAPLAIVHPSKHQCGGLHVSAGMVNHLIKNLIKDMIKIDTTKIRGEISWMEQVEEKKQECKSILSDGRVRHDWLTKQSTGVSNEIRVRRNILERNENPRTRSASMTDRALGLARDELAALEASEVLAEWKESEFLRTGAKFFLSKIKEYEDSSRKAKGIALHCLLMAVIWTGCSFQAQHGGTELTNGHAIRLLERWDFVFDAVCGAYQEGSARYRLVRELMDKCKLIVDPLLVAIKEMKSQRKWTEARQQEHITLTQAVEFHWSIVFPDQGIFPKMHDFVVHVPQFIGNHGFYGRGSEESFESYHVRHKQLAKSVAPIKDDRVRSGVIARRLQLTIDPETEAYVGKIKDSTTGSKRGPYKKKKSRTYLPICRPDCRVEGDIILLDNDMAIKAGWEEVYRMVVAGEIPNSWHGNFSRIAGLHDMQSAEGIFCCY